MFNIKSKMSYILNKHGFRKSKADSFIYGQGLPLDNIVLYVDKTAENQTIQKKCAIRRTVISTTNEEGHNILADNIVMMFGGSYQPDIQYSDVIVTIRAVYSETDDYDSLILFDYAIADFTNHKYDDIIKDIRTRLYKLKTQWR